MANIKALPLATGNNLPRLYVDNGDGTYSEQVAASVSATATTTAKATENAPSYSEGEDAPISQTLDGALRIAGNISAETTAVASASEPSYGEGDPEALSQTLAGRLRTEADVANLPATLDVNSGNKSNSTIRVVLATDQPQLTNKLLVTPDLPSGASTAANQTTGNTSLGNIDTSTAAVNTVLGAKTDAKSTATDTTAVSAMSVWKQISASVQAIATAIAGTLTVATHAVTQSGSWVLSAGSAIIGKVGIDQTTDGTTNKVSAAQNGTWNIAAVTSLTQFNGNAIDTNSGNKSAGTLRTVQATDSPAIALHGHGATGSSVPANAVLRGLRAATANPTAVTDGQMVGAMGDKVGRQVVVIGGARDLVADQVTSITGTSETTIVTAGGANVFNDLVSLKFTNSGATAVELTLREDTAGTIRDYFYVPAGDMRGVTYTVPFKGAANKPWTIQASSSTTTLRVTAQFVKNL